ncbi:MAG: ABC transporter ATP-binding protein [Lachnospiraceae bacterium]|nr:ABC transporter ATP-binding protein [Lachnospiraceae bacterium]
MMENAIEVRDLYVSYRTLGDYSLRNMIRNRGSRSKGFQALKGLSFDVKEGEILGIIGKNGSGKSTLLRAIGGIFCADKGRIDLKGKQVSLLSIGVGFKPNLSGRDNVYLSGLLLGFSKDEISRHMQGIIDFSEIGDFIDRPVRTYSSGMYSKLAFSITANLSTDILLIDEVLSVGDERFAEKSYVCMNKMMNDYKKTVVFVSHSLPAVEKLCNRVMWMQDGNVMRIGDPGRVIEEYKEYMCS